MKNLKNKSPRQRCSPLDKRLFKIKGLRLRPDRPAGSPSRIAGRISGPTVGRATDYHFQSGFIDMF